MKKVPIAKAVFSRGSAAADAASTCPCSRKGTLHVDTYLQVGASGCIRDASSHLILGAQERDCTGLLWDALFGMAPNVMQVRPPRALLLLFPSHRRSGRRRRPCKLTPLM